MFQKIALATLIVFIPGPAAWSACDPHLTGRALYRGLNRVTHENINSIMEPAVSPLGDYMATGSAKNRALVKITGIKNARTTGFTQILRHDNGVEIVGAFFSRTGRICATVTNSQRRIFFWDVDSGRFIREVRAEDLGTEIFEMSPDGRLAVFAGWGPELTLKWMDIFSGELHSAVYRDVVNSKEHEGLSRLIIVGFTFTSDRSILVGFNNLAPRIFEIDGSSVKRMGFLRDDRGTSLLSIRKGLDPDWNLVDYSGWVTAPGYPFAVGFGSASLLKGKTTDENGRTHEKRELTYHVELWDLRTGTYRRTISQVPSLRFPTAEGGKVTPTNTMDALKILLDPNHPATQGMRNPYLLGEMGTVQGRDVVALGTLSLGGNDYVSIFDLQTGTILREVFPKLGCIVSIGLQDAGVVLTSRGDKTVRQWPLEFEPR